MAYSDPQRGRDAVRAWRAANPELVRQQRKMAIIRRAMAQRRLPRLSSIEKHGLSDEELRRIVDSVMCGENSGRALIWRGQSSTTVLVSRVRM